MLRSFTILAAVLAAAALAGPATAQVRIQPYVMAPNMIAPLQRKVLPPVMTIKPSQALNIAMRAAPAAQALGVQLRGPLYIVKLKQGNRIMQVRVNAADGSIQ